MLVGVFPVEDTMPDQAPAPLSNDLYAAGPDIVGQLGQTIQAGASASTLLNEGYGSHTGLIADHGGGGVLGSMSMLSGGYNLVKGINEMWSYDPATRAQGEQDAIGGGLGMVQGASSALTPLVQGNPYFEAANGLIGGGANFLSGGVQLGTAIADGQKNGATGDNVVGGLTGLSNVIAGGGSMLSTALATGGVATGAATIGAAGSSAALGLTIGKALNDATEATSKGRFGVDNNGNERTAQGAAVDSGVGAMNATTDLLMGWGMGAGNANLAGNLVGSGVSVGSGLLNVPLNGLMAAGEGFGHAVAGGFDMLRHWTE